MARSQILAASWYDYPQYYDIVFQRYTRQEADFIEAACRKYCPFGVRRFLEPACGTGRLMTTLAARGYQVTGFDLSQRALRYLQRRLARSGLNAETFEAEMSNFRLRRRVDAAYCTISTFRYLLTEQAARDHLRCIAGSLRQGGIYVLGLHLLPLGVDKEDVECWTERRCETIVTVTLRVLRIDRRRRIANRTGLPAGASRVEGTSPAARISVAHVHGKAISTAARFGSVAGTVRRLRFPV